MSFPSLDDLLACPVDGSPLSREGNEWLSAAGRRYPMVQGVPVLFRPDASDTLAAMAQSRGLASKAGGQADDPWCMDTLGLNEDQKAPLLEALRRGGEEVDPVVAQMTSPPPVSTCVGLGYGLMWELFPGTSEQPDQSNKVELPFQSVTTHWRTNICVRPIDYAFRPVPP